MKNRFKFLRSPQRIWRELSADSFLRTLFYRNQLITLCVAFLIMGFATYESIKVVNQNITNNISALSAMIAKDDRVVEALEQNQISKEASDSLDILTDESEYIDVISIANMDSIRVYHTVKERIGGEFYGGDERQFTDEIDAYVIKGTGTLGQQIRAFHRVYAKDGTPLGFAMVSVLKSHVYDSYRHVLILFIPMAIAVLFLTFIFSISTAYSLRGALLGHNPSEMVHLFKLRNELFDTLEEGILAVDKSGKIIFVNESAASIYHSTADELQGHSLMSVLPACELMRVVHTDEPEYNREKKIFNSIYLIDRIPFYEKNEIAGALCVYRDHTEMIHLAQDLTGANHLVDALRANIHEFKNELHIISGLLSLQEYDSLKNYLNGLNTDGATLSRVTNTIENKTLAALLYGKINQAHEQDITLQLVEGSHLPAHNRFIRTTQLTSVLGNLLQNAIESFRCKDHQDENDAPKEISLYIHCDDQRLKINIDDNGCGIDSHHLDHIFKRGYSTKGENRGYGMNLIYSIVKNCNGEIVVDSLPGEGTSITIEI